MRVVDLELITRNHLIKPNGSFELQPKKMKACLHLFDLRVCKVVLCSFLCLRSPFRLGYKSYTNLFVDLSFLPPVRVVLFNC